MSLSVVVMLLALPALRSAAQSTNVIQHAFFSLKGIEQKASGGVTSVRITNKDILAALNTFAGFNFSSGAVLLFSSTDNQPPALVVHDVNGRQATNTDMSAYFGVTDIGDDVHSKNDRTRWATWEFAFDVANTNATETGFQLWGKTTLFRRPVQGPGIPTLVRTYKFDSEVNGVGRIQDAITIFSGKVSGTYRDLEVD